jgi:hypothetical protein
MKKGTNNTAMHSRCGHNSERECVKTMEYFFSKYCDMDGNLIRPIGNGSKDKSEKVNKTQFSQCLAG